MFAQRPSAAVRHVFEEHLSLCSFARDPVRGRHGALYHPGEPSGQVRPYGASSHPPLNSSFISSFPLLDITLSPEANLSRMFQPSEDSDWEETFLSVIRPADASTPTPSSIRSDDNCEKKDKNLNKKHNLNTSENQPIELNGTAQIIEIEVPVNNTITDGAFTPLWSHDSFSPNSPTYKSIPLHVAEGREDPNPDEGFNEPTSSPSKPQGPMVSGLETNQEEAQPETFFDDANFLQWVINDQDTSLPEFAEDQETSTTSMPPSQRATATTLSFITPLKTDQAPARRDMPATIPSADLLATASTSATTIEVETIPTVAALPLAEIKEEDPEWTETQISGPSGSRYDYSNQSFSSSTDFPKSAILFVKMTDWDMFFQAILMYIFAFLSFLLYVSFQN